MPMKRVCPQCRKINPISALECADCGMELLSQNPQDVVDGMEYMSEVKAMPQENERQESGMSNVSASSADAGESSTSKDSAVGKQCPTCKKQYPFAMHTCPQCGNYLEISYVRSVSTNNGFVLKSEDGLASLRIGIGDRYTLGKEGALNDYLQNKAYVSRQQAIVQMQGNYLTITHIGRTNPTLVNGSAIQKDQPHVLHEGDRIALGALEGQGVVSGAAYFAVRKEA